MKTPPENQAVEFRLINEREVVRRTTLGRSLIAAKVARGEFPAPVKLGARRKAWIESEVIDWIKARIARRDAGVA